MSHIRIVYEHTAETRQGGSYHAELTNIIDKNAKGPAYFYAGPLD